MGKGLKLGLEIEATPGEFLVKAEIPTLIKEFMGFFLTLCFFLFGCKANVFLLG